MTRQEFVKKVNSMIPAGTKILRSITLAQAIVESSDGRGVVANSTLTTLGNALFGIKATSNWKGKAMNCQTREVYDAGEWHGVQPFRAYNSWQESINDHEHFLTVANATRYAHVIGERDYKKAAYALQQPIILIPSMVYLLRQLLYQVKKPLKLLCTQITAKTSTLLQRAMVGTHLVRL